MSDDNNKKFSQRLKTACDNFPNCPPHGAGRQTWLAGRMKVSQEAVRKWLNAESMPRPTKMVALAALLDVDEAWLSLGIDPTYTKDEKRQLRAAADGGDYYMFGLLMMAGYACAFPTRPEETGVSVYAIRGGVQTAISVSVGVETSAGVFEVGAPRNFADLVCLALIPLDSVSVDILMLDDEGVTGHGRNRRGRVDLVVHKNRREYSTGKHRWRVVKNIKTLT